MPLQNETGNAVNIANFKRLIDVLTGLGSSYQPSNADLEVAIITPKWVTANTQQTTVNTALQASKVPIAAREALFLPLNKLITRSLNILKSTKALLGIKNNAKGLANKIRGIAQPKIVVPVTIPPTIPPLQISNSHQSYVMRTDSLNGYIALLNVEPLYLPNEVPLKIASFQTFYTEAKAANDNIGTLLAPLEVARIARDKALYDNASGLLVIAADIKSYVKGAFGPTAPETKLVNSIRFRKFKQ